MFNIIEEDSERVYLLSSQNISSLIKHLEDHAGQFIISDSRDMVVDLKNQRYINSNAIAVLFRLKSKLVSQGRNLKLINYNKVIEECIEISGVDEFFLK